MQYKLFLVSIATAAFLALSWYAYNTQIITVNPNDLPLIKANTKDRKFKPKDPGGIEIANLDNGIYDYISGRKTNKTIVASYQREEASSRDDIMKSVGIKEIKQNIQPTNMETKPAIKKDEVIPKIKKERKYYLRIAKIKTAQVYEQARNIVLNNHKELLTDLRISLYSDNEGGATSYYLHAGPIDSKDHADILCRKIIAQGGKCKVQ